MYIFVPQIALIKKENHMSKKDCSGVLHLPFERPDAYHALNMPVYQTIAYEFETAEEMEAAFCGRTTDYAYSRITNPTVQNFEKRVQHLRQAKSVTALNSGMAAISGSLLTIAHAGANIVTSNHLFGNTYSFLKSTLGGFGVEIRFCDLTDPEAVGRAIDGQTCALFLEIITNPQLEVADVSALSVLAHRNGVPVVADTTVVPFTEFDAGALGIDIEVVSSTKYLSGGGTGLGGLIIDLGTFDWSHNPKLADWAIRCGCGKSAFTSRLRTEIHRNLGAYMTPQAANLQALGLETLPLRFIRQTDTCLELAKRLKQTAGIRAVNYTGLEDNPFYALSLRQYGARPGAMFTFDLDSREQCFAFLNRLKLIRRSTNLFENKSLAIHPASTIYGSFTAEQRAEMNVGECTIRLSVGLEPADDLHADIVQALHE